MELGVEKRICPDVNGGLPKCGERVPRVDPLPSPRRHHVVTGYIDELRTTSISVGLVFLRRRKVSRAALRLLALLLAKLWVCS